MGLITPSSGDVQLTGDAVRKAAELALAREGGILTPGGRQHPVTLLQENGQGMPDTAVEAARRLIHRDDLVAQAAEVRRLLPGAVLPGSDSWNELLFARLPELEVSHFSDHWHPDSTSAESRAFLTDSRRRHRRLAAPAGAGPGGRRRGGLRLSLWDHSRAARLVSRIVALSLGIVLIIGLLAFRYSESAQRRAVAVEFSAGTKRPRIAIGVAQREGHWVESAGLGKGAVFWFRLPDMRSEAGVQSA